MTDLRVCLDALIPQVMARPRAEVLVCDNASTDGTPDLLRSYQARCARIRYYRQPSNVGFDANVRTCVKLANAEYMSLLADDDIYPPGLLARLDGELHERKPLILYINHVPFFQRAPEVHLPARAPAIDRDYESGRDFFLDCGLGFISSLTWQTESALNNLAVAEQDLGYTHVAISAAICMQERGLYCYRGTAHVLAQHVEESRYPAFTACFLNAHLLYRDLRTQGLLDPKDYELLIKRDRFLLPRYYLNTKCSDTYETESQRIAPAMRRLYGGYWWFYPILLPLMLVPRGLLSPPYRLTRTLYRRWRLYHYQ